MKNILALENRAILEPFVSDEALLAFDYDGTLAPIVPNPDQARMREPTRELLWELAQLSRVIVISGRAQLDALRRLRGVGVLEVVGNHGIEPRHSSDRHRAAVRRWRAVLDPRMEKLEGVAVEDKTFSLAIHYRHARERERALEVIALAVSELEDARVFGGKEVVNILPKGAPDKGVALDRERVRLHCGVALYVGDDETDEDVFKINMPDRLLGIRVGFKGDSAARFFVPDQEAVDDLLRLLLDQRRVHTGR
jgi:trehalose 6-phosphate phosphatase